VKPSRPIVLVAIVAAFVLITWLILRSTYSDLPVLPWTAIPTMLALALGEGYTGWLTRARILRKPHTKPVDPLAVARLVALAKASAYMGALFAGIYGGFLAHVLGLLDLPEPRRDALVGGGSFVSCVLLIGAALYLEHCCRVPGGHDGDMRRGDKQHGDGER
jgi:Protein of unknown function (DUF3180).